MRLLRHHKETISAYFDEIYPPVPEGCEQDEVEQVILPAMLNFKKNGKPMYPNLNVQGYARAKLDAVLACRQGNVEVVPDVDPVSGRQNFDLICEVCGNKVMGPGGWECDLARKKGTRGW